jgi:hypothetical protein
MKKLLLRYDDLYSHNNLELMLEANISFSDEFEEVLDKIDTPIADKLIKLIGSEVDVNTNYIDIDIEKDGFVKFIPDDKAEKCDYVVLSPDSFLIGISKDLKLYGVRPNVGQKVKIIKEYTYEELKDEIIKNIGEDNYEIKNAPSVLKSIFYNKDIKVFHTSYMNESEKNEILCASWAVKRDITGIKPSNIKIGKLASSLLSKAGEEFKPTDLEDFVNKYKSIIKQIRNKFDNFEIVKGEEIRKRYSHDNYFNQNGTLGNSCMRYDKCQKYLDIYVENESVVSLVTLMESNLVTGRAILWTDIEGRKIMDRIYTNNSADEQLFKDFANKNGFFYKKNQDMYDDTPFIGPNDDNIKEIKVTLKAVDYNYYPYMDTLKYYDPNTGEITNIPSGEYNLTDTDGGNGNCDECGGSGRLECGDCDGDGSVECRECGGDGEVNCEECEGEGEVECSVCDGAGREECGYCDSHGESDCSTCDGSGTYEDEECTDCGGSGKESCEHCDGEGSRECGPCDGSGNRKCRYCDGGQIECGECEGGGNVTCRNCDGDGRVDCYGCN